MGGINSLLLVLIKPDGIKPAQSNETILRHRVVQWRAVFTPASFYSYPTSLVSPFVDLPTRRQDAIPLKATQASTATMARRLLSIAAAAVGVLMLSHEADAFHNVKKFNSQYQKYFTEHTSPSVSFLESSARAASPVQEAFYEQAVLDHDAPVSKQKFWKQRYFINQDYWGGNGYPVFLFNGGETELSKVPIGPASNAGQLAQKHKALLVGLEHRFYGQSIPNGDLSLENLKYLTSDQQLADVARFHAFLTKKMGLETSKWIAFGGSYSGSLAAWEKLKYPSLFAGAVASSAPLQPSNNFLQYYEGVGRSLRYFGGDACYNRIQQGVVDFRKLVDGGNATQGQLQKLFPTCNPVQNDLDQSIFESEISFPFGNVVQYNDVDSFKIKDLCAYFANETQTPLERLSAFTLSQLSAPCFDSTFQGNADGQIEFLKNTTVDPSGSRQWYYQVCNEFGWFPTTTSKNSPFYALKSQTEAAVGVEVCKRTFNIDITAGVPKTNAMYGGVNIAVENVTFVSGSVDPWSVVSVTNATHLKAATSSVVYIEGTSHTADIYAPRQDNIPALTAAYAKIAANVAKYLGVQK
jgi:thymus-specific serine protease